MSARAGSGPALDFWYEFASTYSFLAAERIEMLAAEAGVAVRWRPFLLGPIFAAQGWSSSPFNLYPAKGRNMWRDFARQAARLGLRVVAPDPFPMNGLTAARIAAALDEAMRPSFSRAVYRAEFLDGRDISQRPNLAPLLRGLGHEPETVFALAASEAVKSRLRAETELAQSLGLYGAPSFVCADGELFWGNDRLEDALAWANGERWALEP